MDLLHVCNYVSAIGAVIGMLLIAHKRKIGFVVFVFVEISMIYIGYCTKQYGIIVMSIFYFMANIYAWYQWSKA